MTAAEPIRQKPVRQLTLGDCVSIIVGIIIGSGVFGSSHLIAAGVAKSFWPEGELPETEAMLALLGVWAAGGLAAMLGALTFAELSTAYPEEGGIYVFLTRAFGPRTGFLYAWLEFWLIRPGNVAFVALILGNYAQPLLAVQGVTLPSLFWAAAALVFVTVLNLFGFQVERWGQNVLTLAKVLGLAGVCLVGIFFVAEPTTSVPRGDTFAGLGLALVFVMFTYGGWSDLAYVAAEVRDPGRNLMRSLILGVLLVMAIYLAFTFALVRGLGYTALAASSTPAADLLAIAWGDAGRRALSLLVCLSCLGAIHGMIFTGSRMFYALGTDQPLMAWFGVWDERLAIPVRSLVAQGLVTVGLLVAFGMRTDGLNRLIATTGVFYWFFFAICVAALFALRRIDPQRPRPFRVPLYPVLPAVFAIICLAMCWSGADYALRNLAWEGWWTVAVLVSGIGLAISMPPRPRQPAH
jgi:amino acid transporter